MEAAPASKPQRRDSAPENLQPTEHNAVIARAQYLLRRCSYLGYRPFLHPGMDLDEVVDDLMDFEDDFCWASTQHPEFYARLIKAGFLCIGTNIGQGEHAFMPKLHIERSLIRNLDELKVSKGTRKKAKRYNMTIDACFDQVADECIAQHGYNWLGMVKGSLKQLHEQSRHGVSVHSVEIWREDRLVAGEIGSKVGAVYTSMTGFKTESGSGSIQLAALGRFLKLQGFGIWDLGMGMAYKREMGATDVPRPEYIALLRSHRDKADVEFRMREPMVCRSIIDDHPTPAMEPNKHNETPDPQAMAS
eukprot:TRINITY_DN4911_c0_g1_i1.p1 TRINITY_DN4911_c0_g1~~TRINITY_DN4911_c0_g1_i1.p1  ORF type:complete len:304 (+),score=39.97 TRINITY_DN4911_c0_g1_i1:85-996(+)